MWCMIYDDLNYEHEANIFANQMKYVKTLQPLEVFKANLEAGSDDQLIIRDLVESYGLTIGNKKQHGTICCIATLESIYTKYGYQVLNRILRLIISTWEGDINSFSANIFNALTKLVVTFGDSLNDEIFKEKVGNVSVKQLVRMAKERRSGSMGVAEAMLIEYNGKRKNPAGRLPINKLYAKDAAFFPELTETYGEEEFSYENTTVPEGD